MNNIDKVGNKSRKIEKKLQKFEEFSLEEATQMIDINTEDDF
jgi:hypothetical protein